MAATNNQSAGITGIGMSFPEKVLTNADFEKMVETNDQWIVERTGIRERHIVEKGVPASFHGELAARQALDQAGVDPEDIDIIIVPTVTPDMLFPSTACVIQDKLGAKNAWGFDLSGACSAFLFALQNARAQVETGAARRVLVIGTEVMSSILDYTDRNTCILFGDGAGAAVVERLDEGEIGLIDAINHIDGSGGGFLYMPAGGSLNPTSHETIDKNMHVVHQQGRDVFKFAVKGMTSAIKDVLERNGYTGDDISLLVPHQANLRIIEAVQRRTGLSDEQVGVTIDRYGNTTSASIPTTLRVAQDEGRLKPGDLVVLCSFGAGFTWGSTLLRWTGRGLD